jgi:hypothetical protein
MTEHEMRFWAQDRMRQHLEAAEIRRALRDAAVARPRTSWRDRVTVLVRRSGSVSRAPLRP